MIKVVSCQGELLLLLFDDYSLSPGAKSIVYYDKQRGKPDYAAWPTSLNFS